MAGLNLFSFTNQLLSVSMSLRAAQHEILAANIANADTPGYRPRDMDFAGILKTMVLEHKEGRQGGLLALTSSNQFSTLARPETRLDGNGVDIDKEISRMVENTLKYEASLNLFSRKLAGLRYAISEGRG